MKKLTEFIVEAMNPDREIMNKTNEIVNDIHTLDKKFELYHHNTTNYEHHKAIDEIHGEFVDLKDDLIEKLIGYTNVRYTKVEIELDTNGDDYTTLIGDLNKLSDKLETFANHHKFRDLNNFADSISGFGAKMNYLFSLK